MQNIQELYSNYKKYPQPLILESDPELLKLFVKFKNDKNIALSGSQIQELRGFLNNGIADKWFVYHLIHFIDETPASFMNDVVNSLIGNIESGITGSLFFHLTRIYGYPSIQFHIIDLIKGTSSKVRLYNLSKLNTLIGFDGGLTVSGDSIVVDSKARYEWTTSHYQVKYERNKDHIYENDVREALHFKYQTYIGKILEHKDDYPLIECLHFNLPHKQDCPSEYRTDYEEVMKLFGA